MGRLIVKRVGDGPLWAISSSYFSKALVSHAKAVPGTTYVPSTHAWQGYPDAVTAVVARLAHEGIHVDGADDLPKADDWRTARSPFLFATDGLREYQVEGVRFLIAKAREGALLADSMRLGKSAVSITAARAFKQKTLIICPAHVVGVWARPKTAPEGPGEIARWWPDAWKGIDGTATEGAPGVMHLESVKPFAAQKLSRELLKLQEGLARKGQSLTGKDAASLGAAEAEIRKRAQELTNAQVIVCHYDIIYAWVDVLKLWGLQFLIIDEAHIVSGYQSRRSDALKELSEVATKRVGLSGTPVTNTPKNLHNLLEILAFNRFGYFFTGNRPGCFSKVWCDSHQKTVGEGQDAIVVWDHTGRSNIDKPNGTTAIVQEETLKERLKFVMLRRLKKDVDSQLPTKQRQIIDVTIPARQVIAVSGKMLGPGGAELRRCLDLAADGKLKSVINLVAGHIAEGEKVLCFCYRRLFAERIADELAGDDGAKVEFVHGGLTQRERDKRIHALRVHLGPGVLACTIDTTSTGIDLSFASVAVFGELTWEPHELGQSEERLYRYGVSTKALIQYVIARGTGDELIVRAIINKLDTAEMAGIVSGDQLKEELGAKKAGGMQRLYLALAEMQKAKGDKITKTKRTIRTKSAKS